jgi:hypothetical protein
MAKKQTHVRESGRGAPSYESGGLFAEVDGLDAKEFGGLA